MPVQQWIRAKLRWLVLMAVAFSLLLSGAVALSISVAVPAFADTGGYPYYNAPCEFGSAGGSSCENPDQTDYPGDEYDWYENNGNPFSGSLCWYGTNSECFDPWGYEYRNCTSFVAWKLTDLGVSASKVKGLGNGGDWYNNAPSSERSLTPAAGDAAVQPGTSSNPFGHVAYVDSVSGSNITIEEYNYAGTGAWDTRTGTPSALGFSEFVNFGLNPSGGDSSSDLRQFYVSNGSWTSFDVTSATGVSVAGDPAVDPNSGEYARGTNGDLYQFYVSNGAWTAFDVSTATGGVKISGNPVVGSGVVWARDANNDLRQFYVSNGSWTSFDVSAATGVSIANDPAPSTNGIWAEASSNEHLVLFYVYNGAWVYYDVTSNTSPQKAVSGTPVVPSENDVWIRGIDGHLVNFYMSGSSWTYADVSGATGINISGNPAYSSSGVWATDTNSHLRQFYVSNGSWTASDVSGATGVNVAGSPAVDPNSGEYARGTNGDLYQFYVSNGSWTSFDVSNASGGASISGDPVDSSGGVWAI